MVSATISRPSSACRTRNCQSIAPIRWISARGDDGAGKRLRVLGANYSNAKKLESYYRKGQLTNDFFVNLLDMQQAWKQLSEKSDQEHIGTLREIGKEKWTASQTDPVFGANSQLRGLAGV